MPYQSHTCHTVTLRFCDNQRYLSPCVTQVLFQEQVQDSHYSLDATTKDRIPFPVLSHPSQFFSSSMQRVAILKASQGLIQDKMGTSIVRDIPAVMFLNQACNYASGLGVIKAASCCL